MCGTKFGIGNVTKSLCLSSGVEGVSEGVISLDSLLEVDLGTKHAQKSCGG